MEPLSLAALGAAALTEGIKFLYGQAGEVLKLRRDRRRAEEAGAAAPANVLTVAGADVVEGQLETFVVDEKAADELAGVLKELRAELGEYAQGHEDVDPADESILRATHDLRAALEDVIGQRITFKGEAREPSGAPVVTGRLRAREIRGRAGAIDAGDVYEGRLAGDMKVGLAAEGSDVAGVRARTIGRPVPPSS